MLKTFLSTLLLCLMSWNAQAEIPCDIEAAINNDAAAQGMTTDAGGTNIRKGPGTNFDVLRTIKSSSGWIFHVAASEGNWMRIDNYREIDGRSKAVGINGWIYAPSLFLKFDSEGKGKAYGWLFSEPSTTGKHVLSRREMHAIDTNVTSLVSCKGTWAKVLWAGHTGWLSRGDQCSDLWDLCGEK